MRWVFLPRLPPRAWSQALARCCAPQAGHHAQCDMSTVPAERKAKAQAAKGVANQPHGRLGVAEVQASDSGSDSLRRGCPAGALMKYSAHHAAILAILGRLQHPAKVQLAVGRAYKLPDCFLLAHQEACNVRKMHPSCTRRPA